MTYRTGNHWGVTIVREPDAGPSASGYVCDGCGGQAEVWVDERPLCRREPEVPTAQLVAVVVNGDQALAERICALLNTSNEQWAEAISHSDAQVSAALSLRTPDLGPGVPAPTPGGSEPVEISSDGCDCGHEGLDETWHSRPCPIAEARYTRVAARRASLFTHLDQRGCICNDPPPAVDKPKNGTASRPDGWACPRHGAVI